MPDGTPSANKPAPRTFGADSAPQPSRGKKLLVRILIYLAGGYLLLCLTLFLMQNRLVFPASKVASLKPADAGFGARQATELETKTSDGVTIRGWFMGGGRPRAKGSPLKLSDSALVVLYFTGNAGNRGDHINVYRQLGTLGANTVCFDYRGYGDSDGSPSEEGLGKDARAAWDFVRAQNVPAERIVIYGHSLGGAVAIRLAAELCAEGTVPGGLFTESTFTRMPEVGGRVYWYVPVSLLLRSKFPSLDRIAKVTCPILMLHGRQDELVPYEMGERLFAAAPEKSANETPKTFVELESAHHSDVPFADPARYLDAVSAFFNHIAPELERKHHEVVPPRTPEQMKQRAKGPVLPQGHEPVVSPNKANDFKLPEVKPGKTRPTDAAPTPGPSPVAPPK